MDSSATWGLRPFELRQAYAEPWRSSPDVNSFSIPRDRPASVESDRCDLEFDDKPGSNTDGWARRCRSSSASSACWEHARQRPFCQGGCRWFHLCHREPRIAGSVDSRRTSEPAPVPAPERCRLRRPIGPLKSPEGREFGSTGGSPCTNRPVELAGRWQPFSVRRPEARVRTSNLPPRTSDHVVLPWGGHVSISVRARVTLHRLRGSAPQGGACPDLVP
jgi:hypothetical protein